MAMVSSGHRSTLNPNAPLFIPFAYRKVEDFSPEWWELVKNSSWFRDFWLSEHPEGSFDGSGGGKEAADDDVMDLLPEDIDVGVNEDEFADLDAQIEELVMLAQADNDTGYTTDSTAPITQRKPPANGLRMDVKALLIKDGGDSSAPKSPKEKSPCRISSLGPPRYQIKPPHCVTPKPTPRRIHQPR